MKIKLLFSFLVSSIALFAQSGGQPINVPIQNPSFEQAATRAFIQDPCGPWVSGEVPGWEITPLQVGAGAGIFQPTEPSPATNPNCLGGISPAPDGITVAYLAGASISQKLGIASQAGVYNLTIYFGDRFYYYSAQYSASLSIGTTELCSVSGKALGDFTAIPLVCPYGNETVPDKTLMLTITGDGEFQLLLDKVSLTFTPSN